MNVEQRRRLGTSYLVALRCAFWAVAYVSYVWSPANCPVVASKFAVVPKRLVNLANVGEPMGRMRGALCSRKSWGAVNAGK